MSEDRELLHAWKLGDDESLRLYRENDGFLTLALASSAGRLIEFTDEIDMSPATATSVGRMLVRKTVGK